MIGTTLSDRAAVSNEGAKVETEAVAGLNMMAARLSPGVRRDDVTTDYRSDNNLCFGHEA